MREREEKKINEPECFVCRLLYLWTSIQSSHFERVGSGGGVEWHRELGEVKSLVDSRKTKSKSPRIYRPPQTHGSDHHVIADICPGSFTMAHGS